MAKTQKSKNLISKATKLGQSMFEVVLAIAVISLIVVGVVVLSTNAVRNTSFSRNQTQASRYAQEALEWLRNQRNIDAAGFRSKVNATPNYCLDTLPSIASLNNTGVCGTNEFISGTIFRRQVTFSSTTQLNTKGESVVIINAAVTAIWSDSQGSHQVRSSTDLTDLREL
jgi:Tfp pilus assembly protein PilV